MGGRTTAPPRRHRGRLRRDFQQQIAESAGPGAMSRGAKLAFGLGAGRSAAIAVIGQRNQPDEQQIFATCGGFGRIRHDITPCRQHGRRRQQGKQAGRAAATRANRNHRPDVARRDRPARYVPGWFPGSGVSLGGPAWRLPGANRPVALCHAPSPIPLRGQRRSCTDFPILPAFEGGAPGTRPVYPAARPARLRKRHGLARPEARARDERRGFV